MSHLKAVVLVEKSLAGKPKRLRGDLAQYLARNPLSWPLKKKKFSAEIPIRVNRGTAPRIVKRAVSTGVISPRELVDLLPVELTRDHDEELWKTIEWWIGFFRTLGVVVVDNSTVWKIRGDLQQPNNVKTQSRTFKRSRGNT